MAAGNCRVGCYFYAIRFSWKINGYCGGVGIHRTCGNYRAMDRTGIRTLTEDNTKGVVSSYTFMIDGSDIVRYVVV